MNTDIDKMVESLERDGWAVGKDGRITRQREGREQVNASVPLARVTLNGKPRWVNVRDLVAAKHLGPLPANHAVVALDGNGANTALTNLRYEPRGGKRADTQAARAEKAQERAEKLAKKAKEVQDAAKAAAQKAEAVANGAPPKKRTKPAAKAA